MDGEGLFSGVAVGDSLLGLRNLRDVAEPHGNAIWEPLHGNPRMKAGKQQKLIALVLEIVVQKRQVSYIKRMCFTLEKHVLLKNL